VHKWRAGAGGADPADDAAENNVAPDAHDGDDATDAEAVDPDTSQASAGSADMDVDADAALAAIAAEAVGAAPGPEAGAGDDNDSDGEDDENPADVALVPIADMLNARHGTSNVYAVVCGTSPKLTAVPRRSCSTSRQRSSCARPRQSRAARRLYAFSHHSCALV
jgi:hypothetical protein